MRPSRAPEHRPAQAPSTSDIAGDYQLTGLTEGTYQITASMAGYSPETLPVVVGAGGTETQDFQLTAATASLGVAGASAPQWEPPGATR